MTHQEREDIFQQFLEEEKELRVRKGHDYSGHENVNRNFEEAAQRLNLTPKQVIGVYLDKHLNAIHTYIREGDVKSEPIKSRIQDARNYLLMLLTV
jgi:hypothetical protein